MKPWHPPWTARASAATTARTGCAQNSVRTGTQPHNAPPKRPRVLRPTSGERDDTEDSPFHIAIKLDRRLGNSSAILNLMPHAFTKNPGRPKVTTRRQRRRRIPQHARKLDNQNGVNAVVLLQSFFARKTRTIKHLRQYGSLSVGKTRHIALEAVELLPFLIRALGVSGLHQIHDIL